MWSKKYYWLIVTESFIKYKLALEKLWKLGYLLNVGSFRNFNSVNLKDLKNFQIFSITWFSRVIPSFRHRFAGNCDRQSRDLTQLTSGNISRLNRLLITPDNHVRTHTWESIAQKYSMENMNIFLILNQESISDTFASKSNAFSTELCLLWFPKKMIYHEYLILFGARNYPNFE